MSERIRVCGEDHQCFDADAKSLEPIGPSVYDPYCWTDPLPGEQIHVNEWSRRRDERRKAHGKWESR
jgi:hypothetical protein